MPQKYPCVYILSNRRRTVFYTGVTAQLQIRVMEHKQHIYPKSFSSRYNATELIYVASYQSMEEAIAREKEIKGWVRIKKIDLIKEVNPTMKEISCY